MGRGAESHLQEQRIAKWNLRAADILRTAERQNQTGLNMQQEQNFYLLTVTRKWQFISCWIKSGFPGVKLQEEALSFCHFYFSIIMQIVVHMRKKKWFICLKTVIWWTLFTSSKDVNNEGRNAVNPLICGGVHLSWIYEKLLLVIAGSIQTYNSDFSV